jgi:hypothetical protein
LWEDGVTSKNKKEANIVGRSAAKSKKITKAQYVLL